MAIWLSVFASRLLREQLASKAKGTETPDAAPALAGTRSFCQRSAAVQRFSAFHLMGRAEMKIPGLVFLFFGPGRFWSRLPAHLTIA